jgi:phthalate 4,5-dioxygenase oxygenase subunit
MADAAKKVAEGGRAIGTDSDIPQGVIASHEGVYPKETDWRTLVDTSGKTAAAE